MDVEAVSLGASDTFSAEEFVHWAATCCVLAMNMATVMAIKKCGVFISIIVGTELNKKPHARPRPARGC